MTSSLPRRSFTRWKPAQHKPKSNRAAGHVEKRATIRSMDALKEHNTPETKVCNACGLPRAREAYGTKQWKARSVRRCTECAAADRPVRAKAPPVPTAPAPAPARRSAALTQAEKDNDHRLNYGAPATYKIHNNVVLAAADAPSFVMPRVSAASEPELRRLGQSLGLDVNAKHYFAEDNKKNAGYGDVQNMECIAADVSLAGVQFAFDRSFFGMTMCDMGDMALLCRLRKGRPFVIFKVGAGENAGFDSEASVADLEQLSRKLGIERASPAELVATLVAAVCPNLLAWPGCYADDEPDAGYFEVSGESNPILAEAIGLLEDPWRRRGSDLWPVVPPKSDPHTSDDDPDDASLDLGPEPRPEATQNSIEVKNSDEMKRVLDVVARFQAGDPTLVDDYKAGLMEIARRHRAQKASGAGVEEEKAEDDATTARAEARLERSLARRRCDVCGLQAAKTERPFQVCNGCRGRRYCSRECQKADWASHKQSCAGYNTDV